MNETMEYGDYEGSVQYSVEDSCFHGKLLLKGDFVIYGGDDLEELEKNFRDATDEYLAFCKEIGKTPDQKATR